MADGDLRQLMLDAEQQSSEISNMGSALPRLSRNLRQVCEASKNLWSKLSQTVPPQGADAHVLLGSKGVDLSQLSQKLETLSSKEMLAPLEPTPDTDIDAFIANETQNLLLSVVEECKTMCTEATESDDEEGLREEWFEEKERMLALLIEGFEEGSIQSSDSQMEVTRRTEGPTHQRSLMTSVEMAYANKIIEYNKAKLSGTKNDTLGNIFKELSLQFNDKKIPDLWDCLNAMMHMPVELTTTCGDPIKCRNSPIVQAELIKQARNYLQEGYKRHMESVVQQNLQTAKVGGQPSTYALVRGYVALHETSMTSSEDGRVDEQPVWNLIYYCLRCGNAKAALYCAQQAGSQLQNFCAFLDELVANGELSDKSVDNVRNQYRRIVANCIDPFKRAVYCLLGACDIREDFPEVLTTADDYLWYKLGQIRLPKEQEEASVSAPADVLTYNHLQSLIVEEYGESYYNAKEQPYLYATLLVLTGQFEAAVEFLVRTGTGLLKPHAIHMALALHESGLLATSSSILSSLLMNEDSDPSPSKRLNISYLLVIYCRKFEQTNVFEVINYYFFLNDLKSSEGVSLFHLCVSDLTLETSAFEEILGSLSDDGTRLSGLIDGFISTPDECNAIIHMVAEESEKRALLEFAVPLYELCADHEAALLILCSLLGQVLPLESELGSQRDRLASMARRIEHRYKGCHLNCLASTSNNFVILCRLLDFFDFYNERDFRAAKEVIAELNLLPKKETDVDDYNKMFKQYDDSIMRNFSSVLIAMMKILSHDFELIKQTAATSPSADQELEAVRKQAQAVTAFSATLPYKLPGDTNSTIVQMMMLMN